MSYLVGVPSYRRSDKQATIEYFANLGVPKERLYIFVQTEKDLAAYQKYADIANIEFAPANGVSKARNNVLDGLAAKGNVLMLDDDISYFSRLVNNELVKISKLGELETTVEKCFEQTKRAKAEMFGFYPVHNGFFMSKTISTAVTVNTVLGFPKGFKFRFDETYKTKEDIELCARLLSLRGKILRYNFLAANAKHRTNTGGCYETWHSGENAAVAKRLSRAYPQILTVNKSNPNEVKVILKDTGKITL